MDNKEKETFKYTYSAKEQEEIKNIRKKYAEPQEDKMDKLRRLDRSVSQKAATLSLVVGIIGALVLGFGMSLAISELREILGVYKDMSMLIGVVVGVVGIIIASLAYPIYNHTIKKEREKIAPEILQLTDELMK